MSLQPDPRSLISRWLPHLVLIALLGAGIWLLARVFAPLLEPILLAAALAMITAPILFEPVDRFLGRTPLHRLGERTRRQFAGMIATLLLLALMVLPVLALLADTVGSIAGTFDMLFGILTKDQQQIALFEQKIAEQVAAIDKLYPRLHLPDAELPQKARELLVELLDFGPAMLSFIFKGTGALAQVLLALIALAFFYAEGPRLLRGLLAYSPLDAEQEGQLIRRHRQVMLRLLHDTVATAVAKGLTLGLIAWSVSELSGFGRFPFVPIALLATVISLLPLVGMGLVWLPLTVLLWSGGYPTGAVLLALLSIVAHVALEQLRRRTGKRIDERGAWRSFLLFLGLIGGLLSFGLKGLVIGPMAVVIVFTLGSFWLPLYGVGPKRDLLDEPPPDPDPEANDESVKPLSSS